MENFYASAPVCTPSRFSLLTGRYATRGYIDNVIFPTPCDSDPYSITHFINPYQFLNNVDGILGDEITIAEALKAVGYDTSCIGKWNLGDYGEYLPTNQGFDYFYGSYYVNDMTPYNWVREVGGKAEEVRTHAENLDQSESTRLFTDELKSTLENQSTAAISSSRFTRRRGLITPFSRTTTATEKATPPTTVTSTASKNSTSRLAKFSICLKTKASLTTR